MAGRFRLRAEKRDEFVMGHDSPSSMMVEAVSTIIEWNPHMLAVMNSALKVAERIRAACVAAKVDSESPTALSAATGGAISTSLCHKYMRGETSLDRIPATNILTIAKALKVSVRWLITGEGHPSYRLPDNDVQAEVIDLIRTLSPEGQMLALRVVRGLVTEEQAAPITGRFTPIKRQ